MEPNKTGCTVVVQNILHAISMFLVMYDNSSFKSWFSSLIFLNVEILCIVIYDYSVLNGCNQSIPLYQQLLHG